MTSDSLLLFKYFSSDTVCDKKSKIPGSNKLSNSFFDSSLNSDHSNSYLHPISLNLLQPRSYDLFEQF